MKCSEIVLPNSAPERIWKESSDFIAKYNQDTVKREVISDHDISYALLNSDKMRYKSMKPFREYTLTAIHHWLSEYEYQGQIGVTDADEVFVFEKSIPLCIESVAALRYSLVQQNPSVEDLCMQEIQYARAQGQEFADTYIKWLSADRPDGYRTFYLSHLLPDLSDIFRFNMGNARKAFISLAREVRKI
ncbi:MAG: hypothetical protein V1740_08440 [Candidatus Woesearchaeota archaeon]